MSATRRLKIHFDPIGRTVEVLPGTSLHEAAGLAGVNLASDCGGKRTCGKCRVKVIEGEVSPPIQVEQEKLTEQELEKGFRLACCTHVQGDLKIHVPEKSMITGVRLQVEGKTEVLTVDPMVRAFDVEVAPATLEDLRSDMDRITDVLSEQHGQQELVVEPVAVRQLSPLLRKHDWQVTACIRSGEIIGFLPQGVQAVGLAVDLGTTKIAAYLMDLATGEELASAGAVNPQTIYGEDVMSRLHHACKNSRTSETGSQELAQAVRKKLDEILGEMTEEAGLSRVQVMDACIVGNTAMTHLLLDLPVRQLAASPYVAATNSAIDIKARELGLTTSPGAYVHILPCIGGFVGADHVAMILASDIDRAESVTLGIDIGTNTEIVLNGPGMSNLKSVSSPSGPAFEGAHVTDGMRAAEGAIERVRLTGNGVEYETINDAPAVGLCGSGIIDIVAELYRWELIDERGRFKKENSRVRQGKNGAEFQLVSGAENGRGSDVVIAQKDIDEIQLAKGAIRAGIEILLEVTKTPHEMVGEVIIAGAFGSYLNLINTVDIGLLPDLPNARFSQIGNGAGVGAKMALISGRERDRARSIAARTRYVELTTHPGFNRQFASGMMFPKADGAM